MKVGIDIPYIGSTDDLRAYVTEMEALGFDHLGFSQHLSSTLDSPFPAPIFTFDDPWREAFTLSAFVAAITTRIEINPAMLLLPLYHPVLAAKQAAEVQRLSGGRLRIAASIGWNVRECESLGVDPTTRGARFEEQVALVRRLWTERVVDHHGRFFSLSQAGISPRPEQTVPLWMGAGRMNEGGFPTSAALRRAARVGDGFKFAAPTYLDLPRVASLIAQLRMLVREHRSDPDQFGIEVRLPVQMAPAEQWPSFFAWAREAGATHIGVSNRIAGGTVNDQVAWAERFVGETGALW